MNTSDAACGDSEQEHDKERKPLLMDEKTAGKLAEGKLADQKKGEGSSCKTQEDPLMTQYYTNFCILFMIGYLLHCRKHWTEDVLANMTLLVAYVVCGFHRQYQNYIFLFFLLFAIGTILAGQPKGANHKNMVGIVSFILLPQQIQRCYYGNTKRAQIGTSASFNTVRWAVIIMYFFAGFHKINSDFLFEPTVSCAFGKIHTYMKLLGYDAEKVDYDTELPFILQIIPFTVLIIEIVPALCLAVPALQPYSILNFILLHLILLPVGFADFGSIAQSFLYLFVSPRLVANSELPTRYFSFMAMIFVFFESVAMVHWYLKEINGYVEKYGVAPESLVDAALYIEEYTKPPKDFKKGERGLVLMAHGVMWCSIFHTWFSQRKTTSNATTEQANKAATPLKFGVSLFRPKLFGLLALAFFVWFALNPYLGLRTAGNLTMFSNLRTEGRSSNHLLLGSNPLKMFDYQEDLVEIIEADKRWDFRFDDGDIVPRVAFHNGLRSVSDLTDWDDVTMTIIYKDEIIHTDDLLNDPKFARFMNISVLERKYLNMRDVQKSGPQECVW